MSKGAQEHVLTRKPARNWGQLARLSPSVSLYGRTLHLGVKHLLRCNIIFPQPTSGICVMRSEPGEN